MLFKNGTQLRENLIDFLAQAESLYIYSAYIKLPALQALIESNSRIKSVVVRWETKDLILGASDLEIYPYLKEKGITLYRNNRLHLKAYIDNFKTCFLTTANISRRGLNHPSIDNFNYELATIVEDLAIEDRLYFSIIDSESTLVTDNIYNQIKDQLPEKKREFPEEQDFSLVIQSPDKDFLISSLPMTYSVETLIRIYEDSDFISEMELNCTLHDLAIYKIPWGLPSKEFRRRLTKSFFEHPFIKCFLDNLEEKRETYFGDAKNFIHRHCTDVPTPRPFEINGNIQILYRWIVKLGDGKYIIDVPYSHSERLYIKS